MTLLATATRTLSVSALKSAKLSSGKGAMLFGVWQPTHLASAMGLTDFQ